MRYSKLLPLWALLLTLILVACGGETGAGTPAAEADPAADPEAEAVADPEASSEDEPLTGSLVIYSGRAESLIGPIIEQFEAETGLDVAVRYGSTGEIAATLLEEGENSPADIFYAQDPGGLGAVQAAGLLAPLPADVLSIVPAGFEHEGGEWVGISGRARVIVYNTDTLTPEDLPDDLSGFTDPAWNGRIGWPVTNASFQTMVTGMRQLWGEAETRAWLEGIQANNPTVYENNTAVVAAVAAGEVEIGFVNHYYLYRFLASEGESFPARNYFLPGGGPGSLIMVSGAGILKTAPNAENAERFLEFMLSPEAQQYFATQTFEYPMIDGITLPDLLPPLAELTPMAVSINLSDLSDLQGTVALLQELAILP